MKRQLPSKESRYIYKEDVDRFEKLYGQIKGLKDILKEINNLCDSMEGDDIGESNLKELIKELIGEVINDNF